MPGLLSSLLPAAGVGLMGRRPGMGLLQMAGGWDLTPPSVHTYGQTMYPGADAGQAPAGSEGNPIQIDPITVFGGSDDTVPGGTPADGDGEMYEVKRGDNLWNLAKQHYGNGQFWKEIAAANGITDPTKLQVGMTLVIPSVSAMGADAQSASGPQRMAQGERMAPVPRPNPMRNPPMV